MTIEIDGAWDIETEGWDKFVCGAIHDHSGTFTSWSEDEFARNLIARKGTYWAHNGGKFDHLWLASWAARRGVSWRGVPRGSSIVAMYIGDVTLRDSIALWPDRLAIVGQLGGMPKIALEIPCKCGSNCGGYCSISRRAPAPLRRLITDYMVRDTVSLYTSLLTLTHLADRYGLDLRTTAGATAWATCVRWCDGAIAPVQRDVPTYRHIRAGYYGGRTQCFRPRVSHGHRHDIQSAYPAALSALDLPTGPIHSRAPAAAYAAGRDGIYTARVTIPETHIPPLPHREDDRLTYPVGRIHGTWTGYELRAAEARGTVIDRIEHGLYWTERAPVLKAYADRIWAFRQSCKADHPALYPWAKWIANSLTGKLAQKPDSETLYYSPDGTIPDDHERIIGQCGEGVVYTIKREQVAPCAWVEHAAHLTAYTRAGVLLPQLDAAGDGAVYCDTDAVYSIEKLGGLGPNLGQWAYEGEMINWECLAPKLYRYERPDGKVVVKGKGMSGLTSEGFDALRSGEAWTIDRGVVGAMTGIRSGEPFARKTLARRWRGDGITMGDRAIVPGGATAPPRRYTW